MFRYAGVVHRDVEPTEDVGRLVDHRFDLLFLADIDLNVADLGLALGGDLGSELVALSLIEARNDQVCAGICNGARTSQANAGIGANNESTPSGERELVKIHGVFSLISKGYLAPAGRAAEGCGASLRR